MKQVKLPEPVRLALLGSRHRSCQEKEFANALYVGGVREVKLSESYWAGKEPDVDGLMLSVQSLAVSPYVKVGGKPLLWLVLEYVGIAFSGGCCSATGWMQASWFPDNSNHKSTSIGWKDMNLPLVVCYFGTIKKLNEKVVS